MPCRTEEEEEASEEAEGKEEEESSVLLLEHSVTLGGSGEVDRLVAQIGEALQLNASQDRPASPCAPPGPPLQPPRPLPAVPRDKARPPALPLFLSPAPSSTEAAGPGALRCTLGDRGPVRGRAAPYCVAELTAGSGALPLLSPQPGLDGPQGSDKPGAPLPLSGPHRRGRLRGAASSRRLLQRRGPQSEARTSDDDPPRLQQQVVLTGNLIKEAVRRLQLQAKLPQRPPLGRVATAPAHEPLSPRNPRAAFSDPGTYRRSAPLRAADLLVPGS
ncbi:PREDICTED: proto-oncogene FRAT1-like [Elephantulus edwardii]|uniref:proto-oncogene FRAT1-like n=1 Tax=Elephantulus edwardii TaxID=28737 RepID=UPI0003F09D15|nr:PREDICTED: proto-oncogene FRAT1-like [Elephantulus edwardii]